MITAQIATLPDRVESLRLTVASLLLQVDRINVFLNGHKIIPEFLIHEKIGAYLMNNKYGDAAKFFGVEHLSGYIFTCDDDLIYPAHYVRHTIMELQQYNLVTYHGRTFANRPILDYYKSATHKYRCLDKVSNDVIVDVGGTGCMAWHSDSLSLSINDFPHPNMADIWMSKVCHDQGIDIICLAHDAGWIKYIPQNMTIYDVLRDDCKLQTEIVNTFIK